MLLSPLLNAHTVQSYVDQTLTEMCAHAQQAWVQLRNCICNCNWLWAKGVIVIGVLHRYTLIHVHTRVLGGTHWSMMGALQVEPKMLRKWQPDIPK